jgi:hypothetical protein
LATLALPVMSGKSGTMDICIVGVVRRDFVGALATPVLQLKSTVTCSTAATADKAVARLHA